MCSFRSDALRKFSIFYIGAVFLFALPPHAFAIDDQRVQFESGQSLADALIILAELFDTPIAASQILIAGKVAPKIDRTMTLQEALSRLLRGSGLTYRQADSGAITIIAENVQAVEPTTGRPLRQTASTNPPERPDIKSDFSVEIKNFEDWIDEIVVTGTRIARTTVETPIPTTVFNRTDIEASGQNELSDILLDMPAINSGITTQSSQLSTQNSGISTISLRSLGTNRTLVLIDGKRAVSNSPTSNSVSLSTIPVGFVERIEVTTGGSSAVYGSDAIAGVVNIITLNDFTGLRLSARGGLTTDGGGEELTFDATAGTGFASGRGNAVLAITYDDEARIGALDRDFALRSARFDAANNILIEPDRSSFIPGGRFEGDRFFFDEGGLQRNFDIVQNGYEFRPFNTLSIPRKRFLLAAKSRYRAMENLELLLHLQYSHIATSSSRAPDTVSQTNTSLIPLDNPFIPQEILNDAIARNQTGIDFRRRLVELGERGRRVNRDAIRLWSGLKGRLTDRWDWELYYGWGRFTQDQSRFNDIVVPRFINALNVEPDPGSPGSFRCKEETARANGCVPLNLFGVGSISDEAADYIRLRDSLNARINQQTVSGSIAGSLFDLPGGPASLAAGLEYREEKSRTIVDDITSSGQTSLTQLPNIDGRFDVMEGYLEAVFPLLSEAAFAHHLGLEGAIRIADYSQKNVGRVLSFKAGGYWAPIPDLRFRTQFSRAQRAPDIVELFSPARGDFDNVDDPCNNIGPTTPGTVAENCRSIPAIATAIQADGLFVQETRNILAPNSGNLNLREETADTITAGAVLTPRSFPGFALSFDYYNISIADAIDSIDSQDLLDRCFRDANTFPDNIFCNTITRDTGGQLAEITNREENLNTLKAAGFDVSLRYFLDAEEYLNFPGRFDFRILYTYVLRLEEISEDGSGMRDRDIFRGENDDPKHRLRATLSYGRDQWFLRWRTRYIGAVVDSNERVAFFAARGIRNPLILDIGDQWFHDIYMRHNFAENPAIQIFAGINNMFNNKPPFLPTGTATGRTSNFSNDYDVTGRFIYSGLALAF